MSGLPKPRHSEVVDSDGVAHRMTWYYPAPDENTKPVICTYHGEPCDIFAIGEKVGTEGIVCFRLLMSDGRIIVAWNDKVNRYPRGYVEKVFDVAGHG